LLRELFDHIPSFSLFMRSYCFSFIVLALAHLPLAGKAPFKIFESLDTDSDGVISFAEFRSGKRAQALPEVKVRQLFTRLDKDADGALSEAELRRKTRSAQQRILPGKNQFTQLDADKSGDLSLDELLTFKPFSRVKEKRQYRVFNRVDKDQSQTVTLAEIERVRTEMNKRRKSHRLLFRLDTDGDRIITTEEFESSDFIQKLPEKKKAALFRKLDRNGDGVLDAADAPRKWRGAKEAGE